MTKQEAIERLTVIISNSAQEAGFHLEISARDWENYGKSRTYLAIVETRDNSKHYAKKDYGYIDNVTGKYFPAKYGDLTDDFTFSGARF